MNECDEHDIHIETELLPLWKRFLGPISSVDEILLYLGGNTWFKLPSIDIASRQSVKICRNKQKA